jgi:hypothetical protein
VRLLDDAAVRREAIRAAAAYDDPAIAAELIDRYAAFSDDERREAVHSLAARSTHGRLLTEAIGSGRIPRQDVPAQLARQLQRIVGPTFVDVWGPVDLLPADKEAAYEKYRELLTDAAIEKGFPLFQKSGEGEPRGRITLDQNKALVELFGKADGICGGRGGTIATLADVAADEDEDESGFVRRPMGPSKAALKELWQLRLHLKVHLIDDRPSHLNATRGKECGVQDDLIDRSADPTFADDDYRRAEERCNIRIGESDHGANASVAGPLQKDQVAPLRHLRLCGNDACTEILNDLPLNNAPCEAARNLHRREELR